MWKGDSIGYLNVNRVVTDTSIWQTFESTSQFRFLFLLSTGYLSEIQFKKGMLIQSKTLTYLNKGLKGAAYIDWRNNQYEMNIDGENLFYGKPVNESVGNLYYNEPIAINEVFSERFGRYLGLKDRGDGSYELRKPDDNLNIYTYTNGKCSKVEVQNTWTTFYFILRE